MPKRYSLAITSSTPASAAKRLARLPIPSRLRWFSACASARRSLEQRGEHDEEQHEADAGRASEPERRPGRADLQQLGARLRAITAAAPRSARGRPARATSSAATSSCSTTPAAAAISPTRSLGRAVDEQHAVAVGRRPRSLAARAPPAASSACGLRTRTAPPSRAVSSCERRLGDEPAAVHDQHAVDGLRDLGEHVARDEHRPAAGGERAQEVAQPAHALRDRARSPARRGSSSSGLAEQRRREPEPLPHAERVALHAAARRRLRARRAAAPRRRASRAGRWRA